MQDAPLFAVTTPLPVADADAVAETLPFTEERSAVWVHDIEKTARLDLYFETQADAESAMESLAIFFDAAFPHVATDLRILPIASEDWAESWKQHFHAERVSDRIIVRPSWEQLPLQPGDVEIVIDPGMSFGTGQHGTTRGCLVLLDRIHARCPHGRVLDMGCGSGILAIAAAKLGYGSVEGFDNYPDAVAIARANATLNNAACHFETRELAAPDGGTRYDLVLANILASVLIDHAADVVAHLAPDGDLILSGILTEQFEHVRAAYVDQSLREVERVTRAEWTTGHYRHNTIAPLPAG